MDLFNVAAILKMVNVSSILVYCMDLCNVTTILKMVNGAQELLYSVHYHHHDTQN